MSKNPKVVDAQKKLDAARAGEGIPKGQTKEQAAAYWSKKLRIAKKNAKKSPKEECPEGQFLNQDNKCVKDPRLIHKRDTKGGGTVATCQKGQTQVGTTVDPDTGRKTPICDVDPKAAKKKSKYSKGAKGRDPKVGRELMKKMKAAAPKGNWKKLKYSHPARVAYRAWYKGEPIPGQATAGEQAPIDNKQLAKWVSWVKEDSTGKRTNMIIKIAKNPSNPNRNKALAILKALSG